MYVFVCSQMVLYNHALFCTAFYGLTQLCTIFMLVFYSLCSVSLLFSWSFSTISQHFLRAFLLVFLYFLRAFLTLSRLIKTSTTLSNLNLSHVISYLLFFTQRFFKENVRFIIYSFLGYVKVGMGSKKAESFYLREIVLVSELAR